MLAFLHETLACKVSLPVLFFFFLSVSTFSSFQTKRKFTHEWAANENEAIINLTLNSGERKTDTSFKCSVNHRLMHGHVCIQTQTVDSLHIYTMTWGKVELKRSCTQMRGRRIDPKTADIDANDESILTGGDRCFRLTSSSLLNSRQLGPISSKNRHVPANVAPFSSCVAHCALLSCRLMTQQSERCVFCWRTMRLHGKKEVQSNKNMTFVDMRWC